MVNLWRNRLTTIATILVIAILVFIFNVIVVVHQTANTELEKLAKKIDLVMYLQNNLEPQKSTEIRAYISQLEGVEQANFISKQQALERFLQAHPKTAEYYKKFNLENTLPPSIHVIVKNPEYYGKIQEMLKNSPYAKWLSNFSEEKRDLTINGNIIRNLEDLTKFTRYLLYWVMIAFLLGAIVMVYNTIHLNIYTRRMEISIMRLVGAGEKFIQLPYLLEGLWISLIALLVSFGFFTIISETTILNELQFFTRKIEIPYAKIFLMESLVVILLNIGSSFFAVQRHIKKKLLTSDL